MTKFEFSSMECGSWVFKNLVLTESNDEFSYIPLFFAANRERLEAVCVFGDGL